MRGSSHGRGSCALLRLLVVLLCANPLACKDVSKWTSGPCFDTSDEDETCDDYWDDDDDDDDDDGFSGSSDPYTCESSPGGFEISDDKLFFYAASPEIDEARLWWSGAEGRARPIGVLDDVGFQPKQIEAVGDDVYAAGFQRRDEFSVPGFPYSSAAIWRTDGVTATRIDLSNVSLDSNHLFRIHAIGAFQGQLYFAAGRYPDFGLWRVDARDRAEFVADLPGTKYFDSLHDLGDRLLLLSESQEDRHLSGIQTWRPDVGFESIGPVRDHLGLFYIGSVDGRHFIRSRSRGIYAVEGSSFPRLVVDNRSLNRAVVYGRNVYYGYSNYVEGHQRGFLAEYDPESGIRTRFVTNRAFRTPQPIGEFLGRLLFRSGDAAYLIDGESDAEILARDEAIRGSSLSPPVIYRDRVYWGNDLDEREATWTLDRHGQVAEAEGVTPGCTRF